MDDRNTSTRDFESSAQNPEAETLSDREHHRMLQRAREQMHYVGQRVGHDNPVARTIERHPFATCAVAFLAGVAIGAVTYECRRERSWTDEYLRSLKGATRNLNMPKWPPW